MQKMHELPLWLMPADIDPDDPDVLDAQRDLIRKVFFQLRMPGQLSN